jgi:hypothetical protein
MWWISPAPRSNTSTVQREAEERVMVCVYGCVMCVEVDIGWHLTPSFAQVGIPGYNAQRVRTMAPSRPLGRPDPADLVGKSHGKPLACLAWLITILADAHISVAIADTTESRLNSGT